MLAKACRVTLPSVPVMPVEGEMGSVLAYSLFLHRLFGLVFTTLIWLPSQQYARKQSWRELWHLLHSSPLSLVLDDSFLTCLNIPLHTQSTRSLPLSSLHFQKKKGV